MHEPVSIDDSLAVVVRRSVVDDDDGAVADEPQHRADLRVALARRRGVADAVPRMQARHRDMLAGQSRRARKSTRLNSSHLGISYAVFCLKKKKKENCT